MICYPWASGYKLRKIDLDEFPNVKRWMAAMEARPAVKKAMEATFAPEAVEDASTLSDEEKARRAKLLTNQRATKIPRVGADPAREDDESTTKGASMFSHIMVGSNDIGRSKKFYDAVLGALGVGPAITDPMAASST